ncbi:hypothetical protein [Alysiella filiformis]|uniref:Uncharacterized protein n=1 Tax=Alysiella filiformis DSM 16848 TaxID=1120981 RepID=A0A286EH49_9NEIS|nr:hypothetical protein [Alysiella filiformis]QMT32320.1 hypothetical protein H3L97_05690 [Alysiella filiformis]UBQ56760.1 hypothetical protein JF568_03000 [Alysiella filiformis DSM 16848]SOD70256.1 hypothetical protein SAMN02746062_02044 [Alysiella filiformis DSM 16848]
MKRTHLLMLCYLVAIAALFAHTYCERQSLHHFDFKAGLGDNQAMGEWWLARAEWAFLAGLFGVILAGAFAPFRNKWENLALEISTIGAYVLIAVLV